MNYGIVDTNVVRTLSGLDFLNAMIAGKYPAPPIAEVIGMRLVEVKNGQAVFESDPQFRYYNPLGSVHGGYTATLLDSCMACAVQTMLEAGMGLTTIEFKLTFLRPVTEMTGPVRAIGDVISVGRRIGAAEGKLIDAQGKILAHGTTSCLIFSI